MFSNHHHLCFGWFKLTFSCSFFTEGHGSVWANISLYAVSVPMAVPCHVSGWTELPPSEVQTDLQGPAVCAWSLTSGTCNKAGQKFRHGTNTLTVLPSTYLTMFRKGPGCKPSFYHPSYCSCVTGAGLSMSVQHFKQHFSKLLLSDKNATESQTLKGKSINLSWCQFCLPDLWKTTEQKTLDLICNLTANAAVNVW